MKAILICPEHRPAGGLFQRMKPLALMPVAGRSLLDRTLAELKNEGVEEVVVLASDRPERVRKAVGQGKAWGLKVEVRGVCSELSPEAAECEHGERKAGEPRPLVRVLDRVPEMRGRTLWVEDASTMQALLNVALQTKGKGQLTMSEQSPGVWISSKAAVSREAQITGPAWIGPYASVREGAQVGPDVVIESGAFIDSHAQVANAWVGPDTYVGKELTVRDAMAWGQGLLSLKWNSFLEVRDAFLLTDLAGHSHKTSGAPMWERLLALLLLVITLPKAMGLWLRSAFKGQGCFDESRVVLGPMSRVNAFSRTWTLFQWRGAHGLFQRWPELWDVICGRLALVGNRPLTLEQCTALRGTLGALWMQHASGVFSLADSAGELPEVSGSSARAHAAYFSAHRSLRLRLRILTQCLPLFIGFARHPHDKKDSLLPNKKTNPNSNPIPTSLLNS